VEISNYGSVSGAHGTADSHCYARLVINVGDLHTAESFPTASGESGSASDLRSAAPTTR
jgi:hypothetical protein